MLSSAVLLLPLLNAVLAAPLSLRQNQPDVDDGGIVFSPANASTVNTRSTFNFTYVTEDDDAASVDVALIKYIRIGQDFAASDNDDRRSVDVQVSLPADIAPGRYIIAVNEAENNDSNDDDDDDDDDDDEEESDGNVYVNNWSDFDLVSRNVNGVKNAYWITVANATSSIAQGGNDDADDTDGDDEVRLTSPTNGTVFTPGADFDFQYTCGDNCDIVRLALVRYHYVLNDTATAARGDNRWISTQITVPAGTPVDTYVVGVRERDATERDNANGGNDNDDDNDDDDDDDSSDDNDVNEDFYDRYFDYDISFKIPQSDDEGRFVIAVANGTTART